MEWKAYQSTHLPSKTHERAVQQEAVKKQRAAQVRQNQEADLARQREAAMQFSALREVQLPIQDQSTHRIQTTAETELWDQIETDPSSVGFDVGIVDDVLPLHDTLLGLWNAETMGTDGTGPTSLNEDDTEELFAEIMQNTGKLIQVASEERPRDFVKPSVILKLTTSSTSSQ